MVTKRVTEASKNLLDVRIESVTGRVGETTNGSCALGSLSSGSFAHGGVLGSLAGVDVAVGTEVIDGVC
jgi:hypothetical protein